MTAEIIALPVPRRRKARRREFSPEAMTALNYLTASTTVGLFREAASDAGWHLPEDANAAAIKLAHHFMVLASELREAGKSLGFASAEEPAASEEG